jgi:hypothetical protein
MKPYFRNYSPKGPDYGKIIAQLNTWSVGSGTMKEITAESAAGYPYRLSAHEPGTGVLLGNIAVTNYQLDGHVTLGAHVTNPAYLRQGIGAALLGEALGELFHVLPDMQSCVAYVNKQSLPIYLATGGELNERERDVITGCNYVVDMLVPAQEAGWARGYGLATVHSIAEVR